MKKSFNYIITGLLIFLFVYASISKLADINTFKADLYNQPFPAFAKPLLIWVIPAIELLISALLIFDSTRLVGLYASLGLMIAFTFYTAIVLMHFFNYVPCSCGGIIKALSWPQHLVFNLFFVLIATIGIVKYPLSHKNYDTGPRP
ncbi:MAG: MauE/DoxX family redox-associated membrane protein [Ginsengibacter sp.]